MKAHTDEQFSAFMSQLKETNQTLDFFCDFDKISENVNNIKLSLCMLNSLLVHLICVMRWKQSGKGIKRLLMSWIY